MLKLAKTDPSPEVMQRLIRMLHDTRALHDLTRPQIRAIYTELEAMRDAISVMLDKADRKNV